MKNPTPGKNPFELESYRDRMPFHVRELYDDMTRNYAKLQGRAGLGRFWRFWAFAVCYLALLMVISDTTTDTILVFVGLVLCGWLYIAVPSFTISVRRLHDDGKPVFWAVLPQVAIFYLLAEFTLGLPPNWIVWGVLGAITAVAFACPVFRWTMLTVKSQERIKDDQRNRLRYCRYCTHQKGLHETAKVLRNGALRV